MIDSAIEELETSRYAKVVTRNQFPAHCSSKTVFRCPTGPIRPIQGVGGITGTVAYPAHSVHDQKVAKHRG